MSQPYMLAANENGGARQFPVILAPTLYKHIKLDGDKFVVVKLRCLDHSTAEQILVMALPHPDVKPPAEPVYRPAPPVRAKLRLV